MNSLLRNITSGTNSREWKVKDTLINELSSSVKEIQLSQSSRPDKSTPLETDDVTSSLCIAVEALFVHGLKDSLASRVTQAIRAGDVIERPQPNFWSPLLIFSHREIIDQVNSLFLVTTDVGRCRAWLRLALNDGLLSSYLSAMLRTPQTLKPYYRTYALLRDLELLEVAQRLVQGIDAQPFALAVNSSLLNVWSDAPLALAGLWTSPVDCALNAAVDVVSTLRNEPVPCPSPARITGPSLDEDHALKIILGTPVRSAALPPRPLPTDEEPSSSRPRSPPHSPIESSLGNSLTTRVGWSSTFQELPSGNVERSELSEPVESHEPELVVSRQSSRSEMQSYHSLLESYNMVTGALMGRGPDLGHFLQPHEPDTDTVPNAASSTEAIDADDLADLGYEVIPNSPTDLLDMQEFSMMVSLLTRLPTEQGLAKQNFACSACALPVGISLGRAAVCAYTACYFCAECHLGEEFTLPARIVHNWDFRKYGVSSKAAAFLTDVRYHPLIDIKLTNPRLYLVADEMSVLLSLRIQLNLLRAYLFTCREPVIEELQKRVWPREYLYQHVHLYSAADLLEVPSGVLAAHLRQVVLFARSHVQACWLCTQKGFVCEICNNPKVIYPFDTTTTYRCSVCCAVFHSGCMDDSKPCPKCERRQRQAAQTAQANQLAQSEQANQLAQTEQANQLLQTAQENTS